MHSTNQRTYAPRNVVHLKARMMVKKQIPCPAIYSFLAIQAVAGNVTD